MHLLAAHRELLRLPTHHPEGGAILCREPGMTTVRVPNLDEDGFRAAYAHAWRSLAHFEPAALALLTDGAISPERAARAKAMLAAELLTRSPWPRRGRRVRAEDLPLALSETAYLFVADELLAATTAADPATVARALALVLGTDEATAGRLAQAQEQLMAR